MEIKENYYVDLVTDRTILSPWKLTYTKDMYENWATDKEVTKYLSWEPHKNMQQTQNIISNWIQTKNYNWCILDKLTKQPIGSIEVVHRCDRYFNCEVGYCLSRKFWNKGIMTEVLKKVIDFLFSEGYCKITLKHAVENVASGRVMQKAGMTFQCMAPKEVLCHGKFLDCNVYYILNPKYNKN